MYILEMLNKCLVFLQDPKGGPDRKTGEAAKGFKASDLDIRMAKASNAGNRNWQVRNSHASLFELSSSFWPTDLTDLARNSS